MMSNNEWADCADGYSGSLTPGWAGSSDVVSGEMLGGM